MSVERDRGRDLPNARMRRLLLAVEEVMGRGGLMTVLRQARLHRFTTDVPRHDHALRLTAGEYAALVQAIENYYGRGARGTLLRVGQATFRQLVAHQELTALGFRLTAWVPAAHRRQVGVLRWLAHEMAVPHGRVEVQTDDHGRLILLDYEGDSIFGRTREAPACWLTVGKIQEALRWATGRHFDVVETACKGQGAPACRYEISEIER